MPKNLSLKSKLELANIINHSLNNTITNQNIFQSQDTMQMELAMMLSKFDKGKFFSYQRFFNVPRNRGLTSRALFSYQRFLNVPTGIVDSFT